MSSSPHLSHAIYIVGPTGCGKSSFAFALAERLNGEIVNADAFQLYSGLRIITARPSELDEATLPHHLYGVLNPIDSCHAGRYLELALPVIAEIASRGKTPLVVGGSGLYVKALTHGLDDAPPTDPNLRDELSQRSLEELVDELQALDPEAAARIDPNNRRYVQRALEIVMITGRPNADARKAWKSDDSRLRGLFLSRPREELYARINARVQQMFVEGAESEVEAIRDWSETSRKAIGVREILEIEGSEVRIAAIQQSSRRYAKRQLTWFQREKWLTRMELGSEILPSISQACDLFGSSKG